MRCGKLRFHPSLFVTCSLTAAMLKVASLSTIVSTNPQHTSVDKEKEKERIFPSTFPHIQNRMVITRKHANHDQDLSSSHLGHSCDTSCDIPSIIISSSFALSVLLYARFVLTFPTCSPIVLCR